jgi:hypothetical protein
MADNSATYAAATTFVQLPSITGTASADTVPAGCFLIIRNNGAGAHIITLTTNNLAGGLAVADKPITVPAGQMWGGRVAPEWGDANGRVQVAIDGTASEVTYHIVGGI